MHKILKFNMDKRSMITSYDYYIFYLKNSRVLGLFWLVLTICFTVCIVVVFSSTNWISNSVNSPNPGYFGPYNFCVYNRLVSSYKCIGTWTDFSSLPASLPSLKLVCFCLIFSCALAFLCLLVTLLAALIKIERIFHICAWIQFVTCKLNEK